MKSTWSNVLASAGVIFLAGIATRAGETEVYLPGSAEPELLRHPLPEILPADLEFRFVDGWLVGFFPAGFYSISEGSVSFLSGGAARLGRLDRWQEYWWHDGMLDALPSSATIKLNSNGHLVAAESVYSGDMWLSPVSLYIPGRRSPVVSYQVPIITHHGMDWDFSPPQPTTSRSPVGYFYLHDEAGRAWFREGTSEGFSNYWSLDLGGNVSGKRRVYDNTEGYPYFVSPSGDFVNYVDSHLRKGTYYKDRFFPNTSVIGISEDSILFLYSWEGGQAYALLLPNGSIQHLNVGLGYMRKVNRAGDFYFDERVGSSVPAVARPVVYRRVRDASGALATPVLFERQELSALELPDGWVARWPAGPNWRDFPTQGLPMLVDPNESEPLLGIAVPPLDSTAEARGFVAYPMKIGLQVDADRDGVIRDDGTDQTSADSSFRFWINDDDDDIVDSSITGVYSEVEDDDRNITNVQNEDWRNNVLDTPRDLEDFARIWISTQGLNDSIKSGKLYLGLKWKNTTGTPAIKLYRAKDVTGSADFLFNTSAASQQALAAAIIDARYPDYVMDGNFVSDHTLIEGSDVFILPTVQFSAPSKSNSRTAFLFEGSKAGTGQLALVILKKEGTNYTEIGEGPGVWLDLKEPKGFIERWSAGNDALGEVQPVVREISKSASPAWGNPVTEDEKDYVLYVHGYNMQEYEKQRWIETTFKRLYWLGYKGRVGGFTWPCSQSAPPYDASEERAWQSATQLKTLLSGLKAAGYRVHLMAHSQGNVVAGEALRQWKEAGNTTPLVRTYIASQAAIQAHCYDMAAPLIPGFAGSLSDDGTPNVYVSYPPTGAPYMGAVAMSGAATNWLNFENPGDYALTGNSLDPLDLHPGWQVDQRLKPNAGTGMGYNVVDGFFISTPTGIRSLLIPAERFKILSYLAEGRSLALGSTTTGGVFAGNNTDLAATLSYGLHHRFHSGQFRSFMSERYEYWRRLMLGIGLQPFTP